MGERYCDIPVFFLQFSPIGKCEAREIASFFQDFGIKFARKSRKRRHPLEVALMAHHSIKIDGASIKVGRA